MKKSKQQQHPSRCKVLVMLTVCNTPCTKVHISEGLCRAKCMGQRQMGAIPQCRASAAMQQRCQLLVTGATEAPPEDKSPPLSRKSIYVQTLANAP